MKIAPVHVACLVALLFTHKAAAANKGHPDAAHPCPYLVAKDLVVSRASRQPGGSSQSGSPWVPLDELISRAPAQRRALMLREIREQLESRHSTFNLGELDHVLTVMRAIDREKFVPRPQRRNAYLPISLDIGFCQTLSDAYIIALTIAAARIEPHANVLDVGTGSGYQAAILSTLAGHVQSLEIIPQLADRARNRLKHLGYRNIEVATADGYAGWPRRAPFDAIIVTAGAMSVPQALIRQLKPGGRLIMPVGPTPLEEELLVFTKSEMGAISKCTLGLAAFVPMTGQAQHAPRKGNTRVEVLPFCYAVPVT